MIYCVTLLPGGIAKWSKAADCKSVIVGSNPTAASLPFQYCLAHTGKRGVLFCLTVAMYSATFSLMQD